MPKTDDRPRRPTIADVASHAQVSRAAVSKVLRNAYGVSEDMRLKVQTSVAALGYRPLISARGLRGATFRIGVTLPDHENAFFTEVLGGAIEWLLPTEYQLILAPADRLHFDGRRAIESLVDHQVDGILAIAPLVETEWLEAVASHIPLVQLGRHDEPRNYDVVVGDDAAGAHLVMDHLLGAGHRRIVHLTQVEQDRHLPLNSTTAIRRRVYDERMADAGLRDEIRVIDARFLEHTAADAMRNYLEHEPVPTAVFAGNDQAAMGVLRTLAMMNLESVAVVGYDNTPVAGHPAVELTSVDQDGAGMGSTAVRLLLERIAGREMPVRHVVEPQLIVRGSSRRAQDSAVSRS